MLTLEDPLMLHIPEFTSADTPTGDLEDVTLIRLATHHSGLMTEHPLTSWSRNSFPLMSDMLDAVREVAVVVPPDTTWKYSNLAYGLLGEVIERLAGKPYEHWVRSELLEPLGMAETTFDSGQISEDDEVCGYIPPVPVGDALRPAPSVELNGIQAAGGLWSSVADLAKWIGFMTSPATHRTKLPLSPISVAHMLRPAYIDADWSMGQCIGWRAVRSKNRVYLGHGGGIHGFGTATLWCRSAGVGVVVLSSLWPGSDAGLIARELLDMVVFDMDVAPAENQVDTHVVDADADSPLSQFNGTYFAEPGLTRDIAAVSNECMHIGMDPSATLGQVPVTARRIDDRQFLVNGGRANGEAMVFSNDDEFEMSNFTYKRIDP